MLVSLVAPAKGVSGENSLNYQVDQIIRVLSFNSFECKLHNYKPAPSVRFRVLFRDIQAVTHEQGGKAMLEEHLKRAERIELRDVKLRNYFRIEADLYLDGKAYSKWLADNPILVFEDEKDAEKLPASGFAYQVQPSEIWNQPSKIEKKPAAKAQQINMQRLLKTPVDVSLLTSDTPLDEALDILTGAVEPHLPLIVLWSDLQANAMIDKDTPIGIDVPDRLTVRQVLDSILRSMGSVGIKLVLVTEGNVLTLGTEQTLLKDRKTEAYSIEDLLHAPSSPVIY
jgi:hypothetical protein